MPIRGRPDNVCIEKSSKNIGNSSRKSKIKPSTTKAPESNMSQVKQLRVIEPEEETSRESRSRPSTQSRSLWTPRSRLQSPRSSSRNGGIETNQVLHSPQAEVRTKAWQMPASIRRQHLKVWESKRRLVCQSNAV